MVTLSLLNWKVRCDPAATRALYAAMNEQVRPSCCDTCENLSMVLAQDRAFPAPFREFLRDVSVDSLKPVEALETYQSRDGWHHYSGFYFFVGELLGGPTPEALHAAIENAGIHLAIADTMSCDLSSSLSFSDIPFRAATPVLQIHWEGLLPWIHWDPPYLRNPHAG